MILTREVEVLITENNISYFENLGYDVFTGEIISVPIEILQSGSNKKILCKCDSCGIERDVIFKNYIKYDNPWGEYYCRKCSDVKRRNSLKKSFGVEYPIHNKEICDKIKNTILKKYGVDNIKKIKK